jgi:ethanolamine utilization protein EutN
VILGTVVGQLWATRKEATLSGLRFLVVQPYLRGGRQTAETLVAVDTIGANLGERVLVVYGRAARHSIGKGHDVGFQCAIVAVVDGGVFEDGERIEPEVETSAPERGARKA